MSPQFEAPRVEDIRALGLEVESSEEPWVVTVRSWAKDGSCVQLAWDEVAGSASIRWIDGQNERLTLERETVQKVSIQAEGGVVRFRVWSRSEGVNGKLHLDIADTVSVRDTQLRT